MARRKETAESGGSSSGSSHNSDPPPPSQWDWLAKCVAGTGAGAFSTVLCSPLDVAKTRIQVQGVTGSAKYRGVSGALMTILREEGIRGWYLGITPAVCSVAVFWSVYFPCYDYAKRSIATTLGRSPTSSIVHLSAAACSGFLTDVLTNPLWVVRTRLATQAMMGDGEAPRYLSMRHAFATIAAEEGLLAFFSGLRASLLGLSHIMIQFPLYERLKSDLNPKHEQAESASPLSHVIVASAASKLVASTITYPHEVIRSRMQFQPAGAGLMEVTRKLLAADGWGGLWHGFRLNIVRTIPQCVVTFTLYEWLAKRLKTLAAVDDQRVAEGGAQGGVARVSRAAVRTRDSDDANGNANASDTSTGHQFALTRTESR